MTKSTPPITVIIPTYNGAPYLCEAIESILGQTFTDFELIIIDDASSDNSVEIGEGFAAKDSRIRVFRNERNLGFAANRNKAVSLARGRYIAWQDQDDISMVERLERQYAVLEHDKNVGMVGGAMEVFDESGSTGVRRYPVDDEGIRKMIFRFSPVALPACMMRKTALIEVGGYNEKWSPAGDLDMTFKIGMTNRLANISEIVVRYRTHRGSATYRNLKRIEKDSVGIRIGYARCSSYHMTARDWSYNVLHYMSIWLIPTVVKMWLFNKIRNSRV